MKRIATRYRRPFGAAESSPTPNRTFVEQVLLEMIGQRSPMAFVPWSDQVSDTTWAVRDPKQLYRLYPVTVEELQLARQNASGQDVPLVGFLMSDAPATLAAIDRELAGTPYLRQESMAVFREDDPGDPPRIYWLVVVRHRDTLPFSEQGGGGGASVGAAASKLSATLVYPEILTPTTNLRKPNFPFSIALTTQIEPATTAAAVAPVPSAAPVVSDQERRQRLSYGLVGFGVLVALGLWAFYKSRSR